ncbi:MAG: UPF0058 family protein [Halobacteria archaeon]
MKKDTLIQLHNLMAEIKDEMVERNEVSEEEIEKYEELNVSPIHVHRSKQKHKQAVFVLGELIADSLSDTEYSEMGREKQRMNEITKRVMAD